MQILQGRNPRADLPVSNAARKQLGIQPEVVRNSDKHAVLPTHDIHVGQHVMFQNFTSKHWYPAVIEILHPKPRSYKWWYYLQENASTSEAFYTSEQNLQSNQCVSPLMAQSNHMQPVKTEHRKKLQVSNQMQVQTSRPKRDTKLPVNLDL